MRVHQITCPHCGAGMKSEAGIRAGRTVPCPKCKKTFAVEAVDEAEIVDDAEVVEDFEPDEPAPKKKGPPPARGKKPSRRDQDDETEEEEPLPKKARRRPLDDTEEEELPRKKKKKLRRDDDEDEGVYQRLKHNVLVRVITLVVLLGILAVVAYLYYDLKIRQPAEDNTPQRAPAKQVED